MVAAPPDTNRPYASPANISSVLHRLRSRKLPELVDPDYLRDAGIPEGLVGRVLFALRFLGLTTENAEPGQALRSIHTSTDEEYKAILAGLVRQAYGDVFSVVDPTEDTQDRILIRVPALFSCLAALAHGELLPGYVPRSRHSHAGRSSTAFNERAHGTPIG